MSIAIRLPWMRRASRLARRTLRFSVALCLACYILYTPIHLYLESHSDEADFRTVAHLAVAHPVVAAEDHAADSHHQRHPAAQHEFKLLKSERLPQAEMLPAPAVPCLDVAPDRPQPRVFQFSGLSPPELPRSWQFLFRAALPVRAPSLLS